MYHVELYLRVRLACHRDGLSQREAARRFGIDRKTVAKILKHSVPPGYQRGQAPKRPKLDPYTGIIDQILEDDKSESKKQRHTCKRIFEWLRDEHGYSGGITIVTDYVRARKRLGMSRLLLKFVQQALLVEQATQPWPSVQGRG